MVPAERGQDSGSAAEEWAEVEAGRDQVRVVEARELEAPAEAAARVRAAACGKPALVEVQGRAVVARVAGPAQVEGRESGEAEQVQHRVEAAQALAPEVGEQEQGRAEEVVAPVEDGEQVAARVGVAVGRVRVGAAVSAEVEQVQVLVLVQAEDLVAEVDRLVEEAVLAQGEESAEEPEPAERERRENG
jgi:hypothetical protein